MTTIGPDERSSYPLEGQVNYVPDQPASGRTTLNRLINSGGTDHADAISNLSGYSQDNGPRISLDQRLRFRCVAITDGDGLERTFAWLNQFRRLRMRYERRADIHEEFLTLGCVAGRLDDDSLGTSASQPRR